VRVLVLVKAVVPPTEPLRFTPLGDWIPPEAGTALTMNEDDACALEAALRIRDNLPGTTVHALSVGPEEAAAVLRRALGMGADEAFHCLWRDEDPPTPLQTAHLIASAAGGYDLYLAGVMSEDGGHGLTGPLVAELLGLPFLTNVVSLGISNPRGPLTAERDVEGGDRETFAVDLPALLTVPSGINRPRYPTLSLVLKAQKASLNTVEARDLPPCPPREAVLRRYRPEGGSCSFLAGPEAFVSLCRSRGFMP